MKKFKHYLLFILFLPLFLLVGCKNQTTEVDYKVELNSNRIKVDTKDFKTTNYDSNSSIDDFNKLIVTFDSKELTYKETINEDDTTFFITISASDPKSNILVQKNDSKPSINKEATIYVSFKTVEDNKEVYYLSPILLTMSSSSTLSKWLPYVIVGLVAITFAVFSYLKNKKKTDEQKEKEKKPSLISPLTDEEKKECETNNVASTIDNEIKVEVEEDKDTNLDNKDTNDDEEIK